MLVTVIDDHDHGDDSDDDEHVFSGREGPNRDRLQRRVPKPVLTHVPLDTSLIRHRASGTKWGAPRLTAVLLCCCAAAAARILVS